MKTWLMIVPLVSGAFGATAQNFYGGVYGGLLKNDMMVTHEGARQHFLYDKKLTTINYGIHFGRQLTDRWGLETQIQFADLVNKKEFDMANPSPGEPLLERVYWYNKYHYIRIPLLVQYTIFSSTTRRFSLSLLAGPDFGWMRQQRATFKNADASNPALLNNPTLTGVTLKKLDVGVQAGIRARARLYQSVYFYTEGAIYQGLSDVAKAQQVALYEGARVVNRHFALNFGIQYDF